MDDSSPEARRSLLGWPAPVRPAPGRWTLLASAATMVAIATAAIVIVMACM
jgi:hypothetical protein